MYKTKSEPGSLTDDKVQEQVRKKAEEAGP